MRWNTSKGFLRPVLRPAQSDGGDHAQVERLVLEGKRADRPRRAPARHGTPHRRASREIVLSAGAIGSPADPAAVRHRPRRAAAVRGIDVVHDLPGVGENLQDHLQIRCAYKVQGVRTMNERFQSLMQRAGFAVEYALPGAGR